MTGGTGETTWQGRTAAELAAVWGAPQVIVRGSVPSTNDIVRDRAEAGAPAGLVVVADHQSAGRGRLGRAWQDRPGSALLMSFLMRPSAAPVPGTAPLRVGLAVATALRAVTSADVRVKWPNDLVVPGAGKVGGVLCEGVGAGAADGYVVVGIGINIHAHPPGDGAYPPSSLDACTNTRHDRVAIADAVAAALGPLRTAALDRLSADELRRFAALDALNDCFVTLDGGSDAHCARGIDDSGALVVERAGIRHRVTRATVRPTRTAEPV